MQGHSQCGLHSKADFSEAAGVLRAGHTQGFRDAGEQCEPDTPQASRQGGG